MTDEKLRHAMQACLSGATFSPARQNAVLRAAREESAPKARRRLSLGVVLAIALALLMTGGAVAAGLGVFGQIAGRFADDGLKDELDRLEGVATVVNQQITINFNQQTTAPHSPATDYETLLAAAQAQPAGLALTLHQAYCDGQRLYFSFSITHDDPTWYRGVGLPTGIDEYTVEYPGETYREAFSVGRPGIKDTIVSWLDSHESSWIAYTSAGIGDGADLADGTYMQVVEGDVTFIDERTSQGFYTVLLPEGYEPGETISFTILVSSSMMLNAQDTEGVHCYHFPSKQETLTFTIPVNRDTVNLRGGGHFAQYTASAEAVITQVTMTGEVMMNVPAEWTESFGMNGDDDDTTVDNILWYDLIAGGKQLDNHNAGWYLQPDGSMITIFQFDVPPADVPLYLRPVYALSGPHPDEDILLK